MRWQFAGGYENDPNGLRTAIFRAHVAVTTPAEREAARVAFANMRPEMQRLCEKIRAERAGDRKPEFAGVVFVATPSESNVIPANTIPQTDTNARSQRGSRAASRRR